MDKVISIVIPTIKNNALLRKCVHKCLLLPNPIEILVVTEDDRRPQFPEMVRFISTAPLNMSTKRNLAAAQSKGDFLAFIDSDAYPDDGWLSNAVAELDQDESIGMVGGPELAPEGEPLMERWVGLTSQSKLITGAHAFRKKISPRRFFTEVSACNLVIRKEDYLAVGGMDESLYVAEDHDFGKRVRAAGKKVLFSPGVIVHHKNRSFVPFLIQRYARGMATAIGTLDFFRNRTHQSAKEFRWEFLVAPLFIAFLLSLPLGFVFSPWFFLYGLGLFAYGSALTVETLKLCKNPLDIPGVFLLLAGGTLASGVGALLTLLNIRIDIKKYYRNENDK